MLRSAERMPKSSRGNRLPVVLVAVLGSHGFAGAQSGSADSVEPWALRFAALSPDTTVEAGREAGGRSVLRVRAHGEQWSVSMPHDVITAAADLAGDILVAGVLPDGGSGYHLIALEDGQWETRAAVRFSDRDAIARMSWRDGRLAILLTDGRVLTAPCTDAEDLPSPTDFEPVGEAPPDVLRYQALAALGVVDANRIEVYTHPSSRRAFVRDENGRWSVAPREAPAPMLRVEGTACIGRDLRFFARANGPVVLVEEATGTSWPVGEVAGETRGVLPAELSRWLRADRRYRLECGDLVGPWFHPAAITGAAWGVRGVELQECRVYVSGVRPERGSVAARTTVNLPADFDSAKVVKVAFVAVTAEATPLVSKQEDRVWLVPEHALAVDKPIESARRGQILSVAVPLPRERECVGKWVHVQMAVLDENGAPLGATGVRSVRILPDQGGSSAARERAARASAQAYWERHGVEDPVELWQSVIRR